MEHFLSAAAWPSLLVGLWSVVNGILHDVFVLIKYRKYDRELLRLLMDGHILITCGIIQMLSFSGLKQQEIFAFYFSATATISLLVYCGMIYPFLKSLVTIVLNVGLLAILILNYLK